jgi:nicotinate phosphoribosyltransferase
VLNAIKAYRENGIDDSYAPGYGVRLDSGDLAYLSAECRRILDEHGMNKCRIFATNSLDEYLITDLERQGACIDSYGVGDAIATSKAAPCFGNVYKLVEIDGEAVLKRSEDKIKLINPGSQITYRIMIDDPSKGKIFKVDVTCLRGDGLSRKIEAGEGFTVCDEYDRYKTKTFEAGGYTALPMQRKVIENGKRCVGHHTLAEKKAYHQETLMHFSPSERRLINPHYYKVDISDDLYNLKMSIINKLATEIKNFKL